MKVFFMVLLTLPSGIRAEKNDPFSTLQFEVSKQWNVNENDFHHFWSQEYGYALSIGTPFYLGTISIEGKGFEFTNEAKPELEFEDIYLALGWTIDIALPYGLKWSAGINAGNDFFIFESGNIYSKYESELGAGINTELTVPVMNNIRLALRYDYHKVHTYKPIYLGFLGVGIHYETETPKWLKGFLQ